MSSALPQVREILASARLEPVRYAIRDLAVLAEELARQGKKILPLNIGDPVLFDFCTPPHLIDAAAQAMRDGNNGYAPSLGVPVALEAIRANAEEEGIRNIQSIFVTEGVSEAVDISLTALLGSGDNVLTPSPEYPLYSAILAKLGAQKHSYRLDEANKWEPDVEHLASQVNKNTRGLVLINPNNPTGAVYSRRTLEAIVEIARRHNLVIFADEIYEKLLLNSESHIPIASLAPDVAVVTFNGLSKACLAPGWRVGWGIVSGDAAAVRPYVEGIQKLLRARLCANHPLQYAIPAALQGPDEYLLDAVHKLRTRRDLVTEWARTTPGVSCVTPQAAFYAFPRLEIEEDDEAFVKGLLHEKQVLVVHGSGFDPPPPRRHIRIVYLPQEEVLRDALNRIAAYLRERAP
jgi:alanine-synthesizing transaminase